MSKLLPSIAGSLFVVGGLALIPARAEADASAWPAGVTTTSAKAGAVVEVKGNLASGKTMDLAWAANSSVACFPATRFDAFRGNHVLYATSLPKESVFTITAVPDDPKTDLSVYAYTIGTTDFTHVPPNVPSVTSCEGGYDFTGKANPGASEKVTLNATTNPYNVVIGVAGAKGVVTGGYTLKLDLKSKQAGPTNVLSALPMQTNPNGTATVTGKLDDGAKVDLAFAAKSAVACWPATRDDGYNGNHVLYRTMIPAYSNMTITATPVGASGDIGVYAYMVGTSDSAQVPPNVSSVVTCEAASTAGVGKPETVKLNSLNNPYAVYIGVVGSSGATAGAYKLDVEIKPKK